MTVSVANKLVELRKKMGLSQEELAEKLGISRQAISKWERAEASPDTDNLVQLAKLYGISLDELLLDGDAAEDAEPVRSDTDESREARPETVHISWDGIHIKDDSSEVHIDRSGIFINDKNDKVEIGDGKVFVNGEPVDPGYFKQEQQEPISESEAHRRRVLKRCEEFSAVVICLLYIVVGALFDLWHPGWLLILMIPVATSFFEAIRKRNSHKFAYPVLVVVIYLFMGFMWGLWHPGWVLFVTIPIYYTVMPGKIRTRGKSGSDGGVNAEWDSQPDNSDESQTRQFDD